MKGRSDFSSRDADAIRQLLSAKSRAHADEQKKYRGHLRRLGFYISDFSSQSEGFTAADFDDLVMSGAVTERPDEPASAPSSPASRPEQSGSQDRDETYVIDLCDEVLGSEALRQHRFAFLVGDSGVALPVDAFYPELRLVVEYLERQHRESVAFFDRRSTVSGVPRGEQRRLYDERRRQTLPQHGFALVEVSSAQLRCNSRQRLLRDRVADLAVLRSALSRWINRGSAHVV